jgi:hypothetical protein
MDKCQLIKKLTRGAAIAGALLSSGCALDDDNPSGPPYYTFTASDRLWLQHRVGDEWTFEHPTAGTQRFRVMTVEEEKRTRVHFPFGPTSQDGYYYDTWSAQLLLTDSMGTRSHLGTSLSLQFRKTVDPAQASQIPTPPQGERFIGGGYYLSFEQKCELGAEDGFYHNYMLADSPGYSYTAGQRTYSDVQNVVVQPRTYGFDCFPGYPRRVRAFYYSRQHGIVQIITTTGQVWNRVP